MVLDGDLVQGRPQLGGAHAEGEGDVALKVLGHVVYVHQVHGHLKGDLIGEVGEVLGGS